MMLPGETPEFSEEVVIAANDDENEVTSTVKVPSKKRKRKYRCRKDENITQVNHKAYHHY